MADLDITGSVRVDASQAEGAFDRLGQSARRMSGEIAGAATRAGNAAGQIGANAARGGEQFTRSQARLRDEIVKSTRAVEQLGMSASQKFELKIQTRGLDPAQFSPYLARLREVENAQASQAAQAARAARATASNAQAMQSATDSANQFKSALVGLAAAYGASELIRLTDNFVKFNAQLRLASTSSAEYANSVARVRAISTEAQQEIGGVGVLYARVANATRELGVSQSQVGDIVRSVSLSMAVSGATATESASAIGQLSQAFASGVLRGEEFNSVNEAAPRLMKALADGIGVPVGALRKMAEAGLLTSEVLATALPKALGELAEEVKEITTISGAFTVFNNELMQFVGSSATSSGAVKVITTSVLALAESFNTLAAVGIGVAIAKVGSVIGNLAVSNAQAASSAIAAANAAGVQRAALIATAQAEVASTAATAGRLAAAKAAIEVARQQAATALAGANATAAQATAQVAAARSAGAQSFAIAALAQGELALVAAQRARSASMAELALLGQQQARVSAQITAATLAQTAAQAGLTAANVAGGAAATLGRSALGFLGGPIGAVTTLLGLGATAWLLWGNSAKESAQAATGPIKASTEEILDTLDKQIAKIRERNALIRAGVPKIARDAGPASERLGELQIIIDRLKTPFVPLKGPALPEVARVAQLTAALKEYGGILEKVRTEEAESQETVRLQAGEKAAEARLAFAEQYATQEEKATAELVKQAGLLRGSFTEEDAARIRKQFEVKDKGAKAAAAAIKKEASEYEKLIVSIKTKIAQNTEELQGGEKLTEAETLRVKLQAELEQGAKKMTAARLAEAQAQLAQLDASENLLKIFKEQQKFEDKRNKGNADIASDIAKIKEKAQAIEDEAAAYGMTEQALKSLSIARLTERKALLQQFDGSAEAVAQIDDQIDALKRLGEASDALAGQKLSASADEVLRSAREQAALYTEEFTLVQMSNLERSKIVALRQVEVKYAKELADIEKSGASEADKQAARLKVGEAKQIEGAAAVQKAIQEDWQKTADSINQSLTDALMRGFESGKDFGKNLKDTLVNMFKTMVLRPTISAILAPVTGALSGAANAAGGGGGLGGALGTASNLSSLYSAVSGGLTAGIAGAAVKLGGVLGSSALTSFGAGMAGATKTLAAGLAGPVLPATGAAGMGATFAAAMPWLLGAVAVAALWKPLFGRKLKDSGIEGTFGGETGFEGNSFEFLKGGVFRDDKTNRNPLDEDTRAGIADAFKVVRDQVGEFADALGLQSDKLVGYTSAIKLSLKGLSAEDAQKKIAEALQSQSDAMATAILGVTQSGFNAERYLAENPDVAAYTRGAEQHFKDYGRAEGRMAEIEKSFAKRGETSTETLARLANSLTAVNGAFDALGTTLYETSLAGADLASQLVDAFGGMDQFAAASSSYFEAFYSEQERTDAGLRRLTGALGEMGLALPDATASDAIQQYRALVDAQDTNTESGRKAYAALVTLGGGFAQLVESVSATTKALKAEGENLQVSLLSAKGDDAGARAAQRKIDTKDFNAAETILYDYNETIRDQIKVATEATGLQERLNAATDTTAQAATRARDAIDPLNQALYDTVTAAEAAKAAAEAQKGLAEKYAAPITATSAAAALGPDVTASIAGKSAEQIRAMALVYVSSLDAQTEAGRSAIAAFDKLTPSIDFFISSAETASTSAAELARALVESVGISANTIGDTFRDVLLGRTDAQTAGEAISKMVTDGIYNSLASGFSQQITQIMVGQLITPMVQAAVAGTSISAAVSQQSIDAMLGAARNAASVLGTLFADDSFKALMAGISTVVGEVTASLVTPLGSLTPVIDDLAPVAETAAASVSNLNEALGRFGDTLNTRVDLLKIDDSQGINPVSLMLPTSTTATGLTISVSQMMSESIGAVIDAVEIGLAANNRLYQTQIDEIQNSIDQGLSGALLEAAQQEIAQIETTRDSVLRYLSRRLLNVGDDFVAFFGRLGEFGSELETTLAAANNSAVGQALNLAAIGDYFTGIGAEISDIEDALAEAAAIVGGGPLVSAATSGFADAIGGAATQIGEAINASLIAGIPEAVRNDPALAGVSASMLAVIGSVGEGDVQGVNDSFLILSGALTRGELTAAQYAAAIDFVTGSFSTGAGAAVDQANIRKGLERQLLELQGDTAAIRLLEIAGMDAANVALYDRVQALQAEAGQTNIRTGLERQILELQGDTAAIRLLEIAGMDAANIALYDRVQALTEEARVMQERNGLMTSLFQAMGNTAALRAQQLAALDPSNRALQMQVWQIEDAKSALQKALEAEATSAQAAQQAAQERVSAIKSIFDTLKSNVESLRGTVESTKQQTAQQGNAFIENALANARSTGYLPDADDLADAIAGARGGLDQQFASEADRQFATLVLAGKLAELQDISGGQLTLAERQLRAAEDQVDALDGLRQQGQALLDSMSGNTTATLSIVDAIAQLSAAVLSAGNAVPDDAIEAVSGGGGATAPMPVRSVAQDAYADFLRTMQGQGSADEISAYAGGLQEIQAIASLASISGAGLPGNSSQDDYRAWARANIPGFAIGTNYVPRDMLAQIHEGEAIIPRAYNPAANPGLSGNTERLERLVEGLTAEVQRLQGVVGEGNRNTRRTADTLDNVTEGGSNMRTVAA